MIYWLLNPESKFVLSFNSLEEAKQLVERWHGDKFELNQDSDNHWTIYDEESDADIGYVVAIESKKE